MSWGWVGFVAAGHGAFECSQETLTQVFPALDSMGRKSSYFKVLFSSQLGPNTVIIPFLCICEKKTFSERLDSFNVQWIKSHTLGKRLWSRLWVLMWSSTSKVFFFWCVWNASVKVFQIKVSVWCDLLPESCDLRMQIRRLSGHVWQEYKLKAQSNHTSAVMRVKARSINRLNTGQWSFSLMCSTREVKWCHVEGCWTHQLSI